MNRKDIEQEIEQQRKLLLNYLDLANDLEDDSAYVARGNGFCDAKYSEDFVAGQIAAIQSRIDTLESSLQQLGDE